MSTKVTYALLRIELDPEGDNIDELMREVVKLEHRKALTMIDVVSLREVTEEENSDMPVIYWP